MNALTIAIASGKGGTGKTTVALNLARVLEGFVQLLDCDVEEPNVQLFLKGSVLGQEVVNVRVPELEAALCQGCGKCVSFCRFGAIAVPKGQPIIFDELCHACGGCVMVCPHGALREVDKQIGVVDSYQSEGIALRQGKLKVGVPLAPPLIGAVKKNHIGNNPVIIDAPPGTSCPVVAALRGSDFVVLVTEPTPFGLHDLKLALEMVAELKLCCGVIVNRMGIGDDRIHSYCHEQGIDLLAEIPDDRRIAEAYSRGEIVVDVLPDYKALFESLWRSIVRQVTLTNSNQVVATN
jgi:MinD superfamily P-loop ATPase